MDRSGSGPLVIRPVLFDSEEPPEDVRGKLSARVEALESVLERLDLFADPSLEESETAQVETRQDSAIDSGTVFVVHGHDDGAKAQVARLIERLGLRAIILHEQPNRGRSVIEKFEQNAIPAAFAVIVVTPDDVGAKADEEAALKSRARQNVILELGYFYGKLGRANVCTIQKGNVEIPTDVLGVIPVMMDPGGAWQTGLAREMRAAGLPVDLNKVEV